MATITREQEGGYALGAMVQLPPLLDQIVQDVTISVKATQGVNQEKLIGGFTQGIKTRVVETKKKFYPGGIYYDVLEPLKGDEFSKQPFRARFEEVVRTEALSDEQKRQLVSVGIARLYRNYIETDPKDQVASQRTWEKFVKARNQFYAYTIGGEFYGAFPSWWYEEDVYFGLPTLDNGDYYSRESKGYPDKATTLTNQKLQTQIGRTTGVLHSEETLVDFIHRGNIKALPRNQAHRALEAPSVIIGEVWEQGFSLGGMPGTYRNIETKYPEIKALVMFDLRIDDTGKYDQKLDKLITEGILSPRMVFSVSTPVFLEI